METSTVGSLVTDLKKKREEINRLIVLAEVKQEQIDKQKEKLRNVLENLSIEDLNLLESRGIFVRKLKNYNLDEVFSNKDVNESFKQEYSEVIQAIARLNGEL
jgi:hypothetical protein